MKKKIHFAKMSKPHKAGKKMLKRILSKHTSHEKESMTIKMKESLQSGIKHLEENNLEQASEDFVKVLKPCLSKMSMKEMHWSDTPRAQKILLKAMFYLGKICLKDNECPDHHSKAAAIFQYCARFAEKHKITVNIKVNAQEKKEMGAHNFLNRAYDAERNFLRKVNKDSAEPDSASNQSSKGKLPNYHSEYSEMISGHKKELKKIRKDVESKLAKIHDLSVEQIDERTEAIEAVYRLSSEFFVNHNQAPPSLAAASQDAPSRHVAGTGFLQRLLQECYAQLGNPPEGCEFSIIGLGSLALGTITPWSDFEFAILINEDREDYKEYFRNLTKLLHIKVINLGETPLRTVGVEALNNFKTADGLDDWFWDDVIESGFSFDGPDWHACKHPLGRQGYKAARKVKNANGFEVTVIEDKPDYELIMTPMQMAALQTAPAMDESTGRANVSFATDRHLVQALRSVCLIDGSYRLLEALRCLTFEPEDPDQLLIMKNHILEILKEDVTKFALRLGGSEEGRLIDVKKDIYRLGDRVVNALADYHGIRAEAGQSLITVWQMVDIMQERGVLEPQVARHSKKAISIAVELRLYTYINNSSQDEMMSTYAIPTEHLTPEEQKELIEKTFYIKDTRILHQFYYVMLKVQSIVQEFCNGTSHEFNVVILETDGLFEVGDYIRAMVHARFLEYDQAIMHMQAAREQDSNNISILKELYFLYKRTGLVEEAIKVAEAILSWQLEMHGKEEHPDVAEAHRHLGIAYKDGGRYNDATSQFTEALKIYRLYESDYQLVKAEIYSNWGSVFNKEGRFDKAISPHKTALQIKEVEYESAHSSVGDSHNNLGVTYSNTKEYNTAKEHFEEALAIYKVCYKCYPNHPSVAKTYCNLGGVHTKQGNFKTAIKHHQMAAKIYDVVFEFAPCHPDIATNLHNLGAAYFKLGAIDEAMECFSDSFEIRSEVYVLNEFHIDIGKSHSKLGDIHHAQGDFVKARFHYFKAFQAYEETFSSKQKHPDSTALLYKLGEMHHILGYQTKAFNCINAALERTTNLQSPTFTKKAMSLKDKILVKLDEKTLPEEEEIMQYDKDLHSVVEMAFAPQELIQPDRIPIPGQAEDFDAPAA